MKSRNSENIMVTSVNSKGLSKCNYLNNLSNLNIGSGVQTWQHGNSSTNNTVVGVFDLGNVSGIQSLSIHSITPKLSLCHAKLSKAGVMNKTSRIYHGEDRPSIIEATSSRAETWNPFDDHSIEAEFDEIHQRGSQGSK